MARSFKEFLVESSGLNPEIESNSYGEYDSYLNEGFKTDAEAIRELLDRESVLIKKIRPTREKLWELEPKKSSLMYRIAGMVTNMMNAHETGEKYVEMEKRYEEAEKEHERLTKEIDSLYAKIRPIEDELEKIRRTLTKMTQRNAKKAGLHPYEYVSKNNLFSRGIHEAVEKSGAKYKPKTYKILKALANDDSIHLGDIDISNVKDLSRLFEFSKRKDFSGIENWDVSHVEYMDGMFEYCYHFNEPIGKWNVSKVISMNKMFYNCKKFNQPLEKWNVSHVENMAFMFAGCEKFNQPLNKWNVGNVKYIQGMFEEAESFNQPLDKWNVKKVIAHTSTFTGTKILKQDVSKWEELNSRIDLDNLFKD